MTTSRANTNSRTSFFKENKRLKREKSLNGNLHSTSVFPDSSDAMQSVSYKEILNGINNMKVKPVRTAGFSQISNSTCANSNGNFILKNFQSSVSHPNFEIDSQINFENNCYKYNIENDGVFQKMEENYFLCVEFIKKETECELRFIDNYNFLNDSRNKHFNNKRKIKPHILNEIYHQMLKDERELENIFKYQKYFDIQTDINEKMRAVLIDWIVEVHKLFELSQETLFLAVDIIDKYLCRKFILKHKLQLLGITSLWIACKYLDIFVIDLKYCVYITDSTYTDDEIRKMENEILCALDFTITMPSILNFYDILAVNFCLCEKAYYIGRYVLETYLLDTGINKYKKSLVACSAVYLAIKIGSENMTNYNLVKYYTEDDEKIVKECAKEILYLVINVRNVGLYGILNKYALEEYLEVSKIDFNFI
jgi:hypothetical protein